MTPNDTGTQSRRKPTFILLLATIPLFLIPAQIGNWKGSKKAGKAHYLGDKELFF
jgi:hypothetical protein